MLGVPLHLDHFSSQPAGFSLAAHLKVIDDESLPLQLNAYPAIFSTLDGIYTVERFSQLPKAFNPMLFTDEGRVTLVIFVLMNASGLISVIPERSDASITVFSPVYLIRIFLPLYE